jgi:hypothetical protein
MRLHPTFRTLIALATLFACDTPSGPHSTASEQSLRRLDLVAANTREEGWEGGAIVGNSGEGQPDRFCFFANTFFTTQAVVTRSPSGNWTLSCSFENLPPIGAQETLRDWRCSIIGDPAAITHHSSWTRSPAGTAHLVCHFSDKPVTDATVSFGDVTAVAQQGTFTESLREFPGQSVTGETIDAGLACAPIGSDLTGKVAVVERGVCAFSVKVQNAYNAGATAVIVYNSAAFGDQITVMGGVDRVGIPAVFVGRSTGLALLAASPVEVAISFCGPSASCRGELSSGEGEQ